ncbi:MAG: AIR synthase family protein [Dehalococcoidales bacterium]|jgi:hydrogenase maturation factor|nr:AIR synthase family protein [Dehalococcoidales bacterium]MDD3265146.1 AIR synthase family protein [Dehalococcoidales bacterium]MDD4322279.1 AIR synthase family protein [Dehalococcoidales bacterium]MDD4794345.1 AIR synthase family protein [Dehalococcoidales bacterium]MDD5122636.1 AIR synthase family protein [Dehalococcoidales bacterium]
MAEIPEIGKVSADIFSEIIFPRLGAKNSDVLVGPAHGTDVGITRIGDMAVSITTDPVFIVPEYGWERAAWFAIHILASDSATSGLKPRYISIDMNLPMSMTKDQLAIMWNTMHQECEKLGINVITGHTGRYENCHYPMVGGATVIGTGGLDEYVTPRFARPGDKVIITKGPAIEAVGIFAAVFADMLEEKFGHEFRLKAESIFYKMTTVEDAMTAVEVGVRDDGVSAMHDATECGIWGGLYELAAAAKLGVRVELEKIVVEDTVKEICDHFGIDPYASISEGTLIILCRPHKADAVVQALAARGIRSSVAGEMTEASKGMVLVKEGRETKLEHPIVDPFWRAFYNALPGDKSGG